SVLWPAWPQNIQQTVVGNDVMFTWDPPQSLYLFTEYRVYRTTTLIYAGTETNCADLDLPNGNYVYTLYAVYGTVQSLGASPSPAHVEVHYEPGPVQTLVYLNSVEVSWAPVSDAGFLLHYQVWQNGVRLGTTSALTYMDYEVPNGSFDYSVSAVYENGESGQTAPANAIVINGYPPTNLHSTVAGNSVALTWQPPTNLYGFVGYRVYLNMQLQANTTEQSYSLIDLPNGMHSIEVAAVYSNGSIGIAEPIAATIVMPYLPQQIGAYVNQNDVLVSWSAPSDAYGLTAYKVFRGTTEIATVEQPQYWDTDLPNGIYSYSVLAVFGDIQSDQTPGVEATVLITYPVRNLSADFELPSQVLVLSWETPVDTGLLSNYRVFRGDLLLGNTTALEFRDASAPMVSISTA
ncbi:MAG TPA: fibronectin type III domain-containing protein, partial [Candidatus Cloacimonadota bacterium]|nr:fibronectin type III domain-containing protein [Candidatus Cloacimonadota bacterium]